MKWIPSLETPFQDYYLQKSGIKEKILEKEEEMLITSDKKSVSNN